MEKKQHTPGPWRGYRGSIWSESKEIDRSKWSNVVAAISPNLKKPEAWKEADARLIAASPAMLAALERMEKALSQGRYPELQGVSDDVSAAIRQAKGEG